MVTQEEFAMFCMVQNRLQATKDAIDELEDVPEYTLWQILARYDEACGKNTKGKDWRYRIMAWMFPGKWGLTEKVSGNDLTPKEIHLMARWSDPARADEFHYEVRAVMAFLGHDQEYPLSQSMTQAPVPPDLFKHGVSADEQKEIFRDRLGVHKYKMACGHLNNDYTALGHPICSKCLEKAMGDGGKELHIKSMQIAIELDW